MNKIESELLRIAKVLSAGVRKVDEKDNLEREFKEAIKDGDTVQFEYTKKDGSKSKRELVPLQVFPMKGEMAVKGYEANDARKVEKVFYLNMIGDVKKEETKEELNKKPTSEIQDMYEKGKVWKYDSHTPVKEVWTDKSSSNAGVTFEDLDEIRTPMVTFIHPPTGWGITKAYSDEVEVDVDAFYKGGEIRRERKKFWIYQEHGFLTSGGFKLRLYKGQLVGAGYPYKSFYMLSAAQTSKFISEVESVFADAIRKAENDLSDLVKYLNNDVGDYLKTLDPDLLNAWLKEINGEINLQHQTFDRRTAKQNILENRVRFPFEGFVFHMDRAQKLMAIVPDKLKKMADSMSDSGKSKFLSVLEGESPSAYSLGIDGKTVGIPDADSVSINEKPDSIGESSRGSMSIDGNTYYFGKSKVVPDWVTRGT